MVGSSDSIACANIMLNAAVAQSLQELADELEGTEDFHARLTSLIRETIHAHKRIIFNGNGYYVALENGCDIDKPKNLAKSVTVE